MFRPLVFLVTLAFATATNKRFHSSDSHPKHAVKSTSTRKQVKSFSICTSSAGPPGEDGAELNYYGNVYDCDSKEYLNAYSTVTCAPYTIDDLYSPAMTCASALIFEEGEGIWYDISMLIESEEDQTFTTAVTATTKAGFKQKTDIEVIVDNFDEGFALTFNYKSRGWNPYYYYSTSEEPWDKLKPLSP